MRTLFRFLLATSLLVGSAIAVHGYSDEEVVGEFTGRLVYDPLCDIDDTCTHSDFGVLEPFSDPRLEGDVGAEGRFRSIGDTSTLWIGSWFIGDADAGWVEVASPRLLHRDGTATQYTSVLVGTGRNAGLSAVSVVTVTGPYFDFDGRIVRGNMSNSATDYSEVIRTCCPAEYRW